MKPPKYNVGDVVSYMGFVYVFDDESQHCDKCKQLLPGVEVKVEKKMSAEISSIAIHVYSDHQRVWYRMKDDNPIGGPWTLTEENILGKVE